MFQHRGSKATTTIHSHEQRDRPHQARVFGALLTGRSEMAFGFPTIRLIDTACYNRSLRHEPAQWLNQRPGGTSTVIEMLGRLNLLGRSPLVTVRLIARWPTDYGVTFWLVSHVLTCPQVPRSPLSLPFHYQRLFPPRLRACLVSLLPVIVCNRRPPLGLSLPSPIGSSIDSA